MGTTLTGTRISDTYDSLLKATDNGIITSSAKQITDGVGNNTPLYISTSRIGIGVSPTTTFQVSGNSKIGGDLTVTGNLLVEGTTTTVDTDTLSVKDPLIIVGNDNNTSDLVDLGFYGLYDTSGSQDLYAGLYRSASDTKFHLFKDLQEEPTTTVNTSGTGYTKADLVIGALEAITGDFSGNVDIDGTLNVDDVISIEGSAFGRIEIGGASGGYIDLKAPNSDDYDFRIITSSGGNEITTATGDLIFNTAETLALTLDTSQNATFAGTISGVLADGVTATTQTAGDNSTKVATTAYVSTALEGQDTLAEVLAIGNTSSGTSMIISNGDDLTVNTSTLKVDSTNSKVGINNSNPNGFTSQASDLIIGDGSSNQGMTIYSSNQAYGHIYFQDAESGGSLIGGFISYSQVGDFFEIGVAGNGQGAGSLSISETSVYTKENFVVDAGFTNVYNTLTVDASIAKVGIRNNAPTYPLDVNGDARITGLTYLSSDLTVGTDSLFVDVSTDSVGIGLINPSDYSVDTLVINTPDEKGITLVSSSTEKAYIAFQDGTGSLENFMSFDHAVNKMNFNVFDTSGDISFSLGEGVEKLTIDNTNVRVHDELIVDGNSTFAENVGIGSAPVGNPGSKFLAVGTAGSVAGGIQLWAGSSQTHFLQFGDAASGTSYYKGAISYAHVTDTLALLQDSVTALSFTGSQAATFAGDVGIGVSTVNNPFTAQAALQVGDTSTAANNGLITIGSGTTGSGDIYFADGTSGGSQYRGFVSYKHNGDYLAFGTAETTRMIIDSSGQLNLTSGTYHKLAATFPSTYETVLQIGLQATISAEALSDTITFAHSGAEAVSDYVFKVAGNPKLIIKGTGNVGIGTDSPRPVGSGYTALEVSNPSSGSSIWLSGFTDSTKGYLAMDTGGLNLTAISNHPLTFGTNNAPRMRITSGGNIEQGTVGTTASAYYYFNATTTGDTGIIFRDNASTNSGFLTYNHDIDSMKFATAGTEKMRITSGGKVGIGGIVPSQQLELGGIASPALKFTSTGTNGGVIIFNVAGADKGFFGSGYHLGTGSSNDTAMRGEGDLVFLSNGNNQRMRITSGGDIEIPTDSASIKLRSSGSSSYTSIFRNAGNSLIVTNTAETAILTFTNGGNMTIAGTLTQNSDITLKENIKPLQSQLDVVNKLNPVSYNRIGKKENEIGFIAQEVEKLIPDLVSENSDGLKSLAYGNMTSILVKAIQELKAEVDKLKQECKCKN